MLHKARILRNPWAETNEKADFPSLTEGIGSHYFAKAPSGLICSGFAGEMCVLLFVRRSWDK